MSSKIGCKSQGSRHTCLSTVSFFSLVIKEPFLLSAEEPLEVESQRRRGSDSSTKKPLFLSRGDGSTVRSVEFSSFVLGLGIGLGLVLSVDSTTGGVELAATLLNMKFHSISVPRFIFILDAVIILAGIGFFGVEMGLYAILAVFVTDQFISWIVEGTNYAKGAWIISDKSEEIAAALLSELRRGVTSFSATGKCTGQRREVLFCVFSQKEVYSVKSIIMNIDRNAFFIVMDIREVLGRGFADK